MLTEGVQLFNLVPLGLSMQVLESMAATAAFDQIMVGGAVVQYANL